jgi:hypothetical protein
MEVSPLIAREGRQGGALHEFLTRASPRRWTPGLPEEEVCALRKVLFLFLPVALAIILIPGVLLIGCGGGDEATTTTAPPTTPAPATTASVPTTASATSTSETPTTAEQTMGDELVGIWTSEQGIELEFTSDGAVFLRYQGQQVESSYSAKEGKVFYIDFEPNKQGERVPVEVEYTVDGDKLVWDVGGGGELTFARK